MKYETKYPITFDNFIKKLLDRGFSFYHRGFAEIGYKKNSGLLLLTLPETNSENAQRQRAECYSVDEADCIALDLERFY